MIQVHDRVYVGDNGACSEARGGRAYVHACKSPCHQRALNYRGSLSSTHPNYLVLQREEHLYLNLIDPPGPLFKIESFRSFRGFAATQWQAGKELVIHCNQGESRAPSLALLFMAKDLHAVPADSFTVARTSFSSIYPAYRPGRGIVAFLEKSWDQL